MTDRLNDFHPAQASRADSDLSADSFANYENVALNRSRRPRQTDADSCIAMQSVGKSGAFVIQKHWASDLHYDLRLELDGKMKSWSISKGPSLDPGVRRIAVHTEDHPLSYNSFEGFVKSGHRTAGEVILWDRGEWSPLQDARKGLNEGHLSFRLEGDKLQGTWELLRLHSGPKDDENWLLIKQDDEFARTLNQYDVLEAEPDSINLKQAKSKRRSGSARHVHSEANPSPDNARKDSRKNASRFCPYHPATVADMAAISDTTSYYAAARDILIEHLLYRPVTLHHAVLSHKSETATSRPSQQSQTVHSDPDALLSYATERTRSGELGLHHAEHPDALDAGNEILMAINTAATLEHMVELDAIEFHTRNMRWRDQLQPLDQPDRMIFALNAVANDADSKSGKKKHERDLCMVALTLRDLLEQIGLVAFVKTDGLHGLHVDVPIHPEFSWATVYSFSRAIVDMVVQQSDIAVSPHRAHVSQPRKQHKDAAAEQARTMVYIECLHNEPGQTTRCAWSLCGSGNNPAVSVPLDWNELDDASTLPAWHLDNVAERLVVGNHPWQAYQRSARPLGRAMNRAGFEV